MLRKREIIVGKFYISSDRRIAREELSTSSQTVRFNTYHLDTGNSCGTPSECLIQDFVRWAIKEASPKELAFLQDEGMETP